MKKRILCLLLTAVLLLGLVPGWAMGVSAASDMSPSEHAIALIKTFEGFSKFPYYDYSQYSVGYGTACEKNDYPEGISMEEADELLREHIAGDVEKINSFAKKNGLNLTQRQFDALVSFTYNLGTTWMSDNSQTITTAIIRGDTGSDLIFAMTQWSAANGQILANLVKRRLCEANLYINGVYSISAPKNYGYVLYSYGDGDGETRIQGYNAAETTTVLAEAELEGYRFLGWYTAEEGGQWVTNLDANTLNKTLYARWQEGDGSVDEDGYLEGTAASYVRYAAANGQQVVREEPSLNGDELWVLDAGEKLEIVADYVDANNVKWGWISDGGWVNLSQTTTNVVKAEEDKVEEIDPGVPIVTVTGDALQVRTGPGTNYKRVSTVYRGERLAITDVREGEDYLWGKCTAGWVCLDYTNYKELVKDETEEEPEQEKPETPEQEKPEQGQQPGTTVGTPGVVVNCTGLRIRSGAGASHPSVGTLAAGTPVTILETAVAGGVSWGRIDKGWICMNYVQLAGSSAPEVSTSFYGVVNATKLNVRSAAGTSSALVGSLKKGDRVEILETTTVNGGTWGRTSTGWVHMNYIIQESGSTGNTGNTGNAGNTGNTGSTDTPSQTPPADTGNTQSLGTGKVSVNSLRVRSAAGTSGSVVGSLAGGTSVTILEMTKVGGNSWGRIAEGWICLDYVKMETFVGTISCTSLRIRSVAGTGGSIVGSYGQGTQVMILETKTVSGQKWGRTDKGWICLSYVK